MAETQNQAADLPFTPPNPSPGQHRLRVLGRTTPACGAFVVVERNGLILRFPLRNS